MCEGETETHMHLIQLTAPLSHPEAGSQSNIQNRLEESQTHAGRHSERTYKHNVTCEKKQEGCRAQRNGVKDSGKERERENNESG